MLGADRRIADRETADLGRGRDVGLHQRRRDAQHVGDVVEAFARVVARKQRRGIDRQIEQIADGVGVFRAIEAMQHRRARVRSRGGGAVERVLHGRSEPIERGAVRPRRAGRRHHAGAHLPHHLFPGLRVLVPACATSSRSSSETARRITRVVTGDAVAIEQRACGSRRAAVRALGRGRRRSTAGGTSPARSGSATLAQCEHEQRRGGRACAPIMAARSTSRHQLVRAARSSPACAPRRRRRERRPPPSAAASVLPCP